MIILAQSFLYDKHFPFLYKLLTSNKIDARSGYVQIGDNRYYVVLVNSEKQNFFRDQFTLAHELGHAIHQTLADKNGYLMSRTPLTLAETASVFGEQLTFRKILNQEQRGVVLNLHLTPIYY